MTRTEILGIAAGAAAATFIATSWRRSQYIDFNGKSVVITGGSRGLGLVMARELADMGARVALIARSREELERAGEDIIARGGSVRTLACDLRDRNQVDAAVTLIAEESGIDILINNAGVIQVGPSEEMTVKDFQDAMNTHFWGPFHAIQAALPYLRRSATPRIVNISSIGGKIAVPHLLPYSASKFALTGLSEGLHAELAREGIGVTTVCPGLMRTGSTYNAWFKGDTRKEFAWFHIADSLPGLSTSAEAAARKILNGCRRGDAEVIITLPAKAAVIVNALFPSVMAAAMRLTNRLLPRGGEGKAAGRSGWQSVSRVAPSRITRLADRATRANNEIPSSA